MDSKLVGHYRGTLLALLEDLGTDLAAVTSRIRHLYDNPDDFDQELNSVDHSENVLQWLSAAERQQIDRVVEALERIESGEYGHCLYCTREIHPDRLEALPATTSCIRCQERIESGMLDVESRHDELELSA